MGTPVLHPVGEMLECGNCEPLKATVHGAVLALAALCAAYNIAAWLKRREPHLAINALLYGTTVWWERCQVTHHLVACRSESPTDTRKATPKLPTAA